MPLNPQKRKAKYFDVILRSRKENCLCMCRRNFKSCYFQNQWLFLRCQESPREKVLFIIYLFYTFRTLLTFDIQIMFSKLVFNLKVYSHSWHLCLTTVMNCFNQIFVYLCLLIFNQWFFKITIEYKCLYY